MSKAGAKRAQRIAQLRLQIGHDAIAALEADLRVAHPEQGSSHQDYDTALSSALDAICGAVALYLSDWPSDPTLNVAKINLKRIKVVADHLRGIAEATEHLNVEEKYMIGTALRELDDALKAPVVVSATATGVSFIETWRLFAERALVLSKIIGAIRTRKGDEANLGVVILFQAAANSWLDFTGALPVLTEVEHQPRAPLFSLLRDMVESATDRSDLLDALSSDRFLAVISALDAGLAATAPRRAVREARRKQRRTGRKRRK